MMMKAVWLFAFFFLNGLAYGQDSCGIIIEKPDSIASYKQGNSSLHSYLYKELAPEISVGMKVDGNIVSRLTLVLTIDTKGMVTGVEILSNEAGPECRKRIEKKLLSMGGWKPAISSGQSVCSKYRWPIGCILWD